MITLSNTNQKQQELSLLYHLYNSFRAEGDTESSQKIIQLVNKLKENEYSIGFCGHFSAGKSSMMNKLMGENILPSSPIPTSANLVKVKKGRPYARVFYKHEDPIEFPEPYDYDVVKGYCKDGDAIESIEISKENIQLPEGISILDTPGIDSTDEAHLMATESALHLADIIFYVMDYNHVQSEQNFMFTKALKEKGKPVYLIINQIDKHDDHELDFSEFQASAAAAFENWGVQVDGIFYTSLKAEDHPFNQYKQLEEFLYTKIDHKDELLIESVHQSSIQLVEEHIQFKQEKVQEDKNKLEEKIEYLSEEERKSAVEAFTSLIKEKESLSNKTNQFENDFEERLAKLLDNAYLMPAETREFARAFIESCQSDFKVGLLFSKKKTEEERNNRLKNFYEDFTKQVKAQLDWHIKDVLTKFLKEYKLDKEQLMQNVYDLQIIFNEDLLSSVVKKGAGVTGDYVLNYTKDVSEEIKRLYRRAARDLMEQAKQLLQEEIEEELTHINEKLTKYESIKEVLENLSAIDLKIEAVHEKLSKLTKDTPQVNEKELEAWLNETGGSEIEIKQQVMYIDERKSQTSETKEENTVIDKKLVSEAPKQQVDYQDRIIQTAKKLKDAKGFVGEIKGIQSIARDMEQKAERLENNQFTVALFGAFSAGKSSFANALIGEKVLPVSPNPTTATINKITGPTKEHEHGTVKVILKTREQLLKDISNSLKVFEVSCQTIEEALAAIDHLDYDGKDPKVKTHYSFLQAAKQGYDDSKAHLDSFIYVDLQEFQEYVANEKKACFVESVELYYDCPLTRQGITLVDTPGADSINARHTGVAFEYIKNADAILFVTYYNHAFSKADREFLIQLGRVKETFELDKMFFVVNAADLAKDEEELASVKNYVGDQLVQYGIRFPKIYSLSSKGALQEKLNKTSAENAVSGIYRFEQDFEAFIMGDLMDMTIQAAHEDLKYTVSILDEIITNAKEDDEVKKEKLILAKETKQKIIEKLQAIETYSEEKAIEQEINELIHYVKQRVMFRSNDFFTEAFNPSSLQDDGRNMKKALQACLKELLESIGFDLSQEMRATALRVEKFMTGKLVEIVEKANRVSKQLNPNIHSMSYKDQTFSSLDFQNPVENFDLARFSKELAAFKNPKDFFEKGGKVKMKESIQELLHSPMDQYLEDQSKRMQDHYFAEFKDSSNESIDVVLQEIDDIYEGIFAALTETIDIEVIEESRKQVYQLCKTS